MKGGVKNERGMEDENREMGREQGKSNREKEERGRGDWRAAGDTNGGQASEGPRLSGQRVCVCVQLSGCFDHVSEYEV